MFTDEHARDYDQKGYFVVDDAIDPRMLEELRAAARRIKARVRGGEVDVYTDFRGEGEPYHIVGLISPEFGEPIFGEYLAAPTMLAYVKAQIGDELRMSSMAIFTNPHNEPFHMGWHRDVGQEPRDLPEGAELEFLRRPRTECRWELALADEVRAGLPESIHLYYDRWKAQYLN